MQHQEKETIAITLVTPPLSQLNTPYPATPYLSNFLIKNGVSNRQRDLGLELMLRLLSKQGLTELFDELESREELPIEGWTFLANREHHEGVVDTVVSYLQNSSPSMASRIVSGALLPHTPRVSNAKIEPFGRMGQTDLARHLCTLYIEDIVDLVGATIDNGFQLSRYQHHLATSPTSFDDIEARLSNTTIIDRWLDELSDSVDTSIVAITVPFPGNLYSALRVGRSLKTRGITVYIGGGYVNTELREVSEPRLWQYCDALTYDDGEGPLLALIEYSQGGEDKRHRTLTKDGRFDKPHPTIEPIKSAHYGELPLGRYLQLLETLNPAHRLWADGRWNKITIAHGCYWRRCTFCDVTLDYVGNYRAGKAVELVDEMERLIKETGETGFHFVDEAAPPKLMKAIAREILSRNLTITWWGNIRFETSFTPDVCRLLAASGLVAVTGGLEVASDRLLAKMDKGITLAETIQVTNAFAEANISTHAYLMYGFPTQSELETVNSMEFVRQMFESRLISSAFWHKFVLTKHSLVYRDLSSFEIDVIPHDQQVFASNDIPHSENIDHDKFDLPLPKSLASWLRGDGLEREVTEWFEEDVISPTIAKDFVTSELKKENTVRKTGTIIWVGKGVLQMDGAIRLFNTAGEVDVYGNDEELEWLLEVIDSADASADLRLKDIINVFPGDWVSWSGRNWPSCNWAGLITV